MEVINAAPQRSSVIFKDVVTHQGLPPFKNLYEPGIKLLYPTVSAMPGGYPEVIIVAWITHEPPELIYFRYFDNPEDYGGAPNWGYLPIKPPVDGEPIPWLGLENRVFEMNFPDSGYYNYQAEVLAYKDIDLAQPGLELLVRILAENYNHCKMRHQLRLYNVLHWQQLWCVDLTYSNSILPLFEQEERIGWVVATDITGQGVKVNGMSDSNSYLLHLDNKGQIISSPVQQYYNDAELCIRRLIPHPGDNDLMIISSSYKVGMRDCNLLEIRRRSDFGVIKRIHTGFIDYFLAVPHTDDSDGEVQIIVLDKSNNICMYDEELTLLRHKSFNEKCYFLQTMPGINSPSVERGDIHYLFGTSSGRLLLMDKQLRVMSADRVAESVLSQHPYFHLFNDRAFSAHTVDNIEYWWVNTISGSFRGHWVKRPRMLFYAVVTSVSGLFVWLLFYAFVLLQRWRFYRSTVDTMFRHSPDGILILDRHDRVRTLNKRFRDLLQKNSHTGGRGSDSTRIAKPADYRKTKIERLLTPTQLKPLFNQLIVDSQSNGTIDLLEDNQPVTVYYRLDEMRLGRHSFGKALILQDITRQVSETRRTIWKFMAQNTAHRLKSPLQRIIFAAESVILKQRKERLETESLLASQQEILDTAREINQTIYDFLDLSDRQIKPKRLDLRKFLLRNMMNYRDKNLADGVIFNLELPDELPTVMADDYHLLTALINLLDNSLKAVQGTGKIEVYARVLAAEAGDDCDWVRLIVQDDGVGIAEADQPRIFEPHESFFSDGHGIGLAVVYGIVKAHNGRISFRSLLEEGTSFFLDLPVAHEPDSDGTDSDQID